MKREAFCSQGLQGALVLIQAVAASCTPLSQVLDCPDGQAAEGGLCRAVCVDSSDCAATGEVCLDRFCVDGADVAARSAICGEEVAVELCTDFSSCATWLRCVDPCPEAPPDIANGRDDDCDGLVDEDAVNACTNQRCGEHGSCVLELGKARCNCDEGFVAAVDVLSCASAGPCHGVNCGGHGHCEELAGVARCNCEDGYLAQGLACEPDPSCTCEGRCAGADDGCGHTCAEDRCAHTCCGTVCCGEGQLCGEGGQCCEAHTCVDHASGDSYQSCEACLPPPCQSTGPGPLEGCARGGWCDWRDGDAFCPPAEATTTTGEGSAECRSYLNRACCDNTRQIYTDDNSHYEWVTWTEWEGVKPACAP
ncbi:MAG: hypothetical protein ABIJ09_24470 [Pseudomonadota bacterium]